MAIFVGLDAQFQAGNLAGIFLEDACHGGGAVDAAAGDDFGADRMIEAADAARATPMRKSEPKASTMNPRISSAVENCVYCGGAPGNAPDGAGSLPEAARAAVAET